MRPPRFPGALVALALVAGLANSTAAQQPAGLIGDLLRDLEDVETKLLGLARAIPADKYGWTPGPGVRTAGEVFQHVAADNFFLPTAVGTAAPEDTGIKPGNYDSVLTYERRKVARDQIINELERSFAHVKKAIRDTPESRLNEVVSLFGQQASVRYLWLLTTTHVHEHLGQAIAYARSNGIVPPWSRGG